MILVMNKKHGVGCTTLAFNLGMLYNIPIYVKNDSFMLDKSKEKSPMLDRPHVDSFPSVSKITPSKKDGIMDIGAEYSHIRFRKFIKSASVIVVPLDFGYETILHTIDTLDYVRELNDSVPIVMVLNRLNKQDYKRDFNYKEYIFNRLDDAGYNFETENLQFTYLRNSYGLSSNLDSGKYFLDNFIVEDRLEEFKNLNKEVKHSQYDLFLHLVYNALKDTDYTDTDVYDQEKDIVVFRTHFLAQKYSYSQLDFKRYINPSYVLKENKLLRDMAYISDCVYGHCYDICKESEFRKREEKYYNFSKENGKRDRAWF